MQKYLTEMCSLIPELKNIKTITLINAGYSSEFKYNILTEYNTKYLLRLTSYKFAAHKQFEMQSLNKLINMGVKCSKPLTHGYTVDQNCYYALLTWIEGIDASKALYNLSNDNQYDIGFNAGQDLKLIHSLKHNKENNWHSNYLRKWQLNKRVYLQDNIRLKDDNFILNFIENNIGIIKDRPCSFLHDDFHPDNIVVNNGFYAGAIDFNRCTYGDPWHDFAKLFFYGSEISKSYCRGQLHSYFNHKIPSCFWKINALYTAVIIINTISWIKKSSPQHLSLMMKRANKLVNDFESFHKVKPSWIDKDK